MQNSNLYTVDILDWRKNGEKTQSFLLRCCDYLFQKNNQYFYLSSYVNVLGIAISIVIFLLVESARVFCIQAFSYFILALLVNPFARVYRAFRHMYLRRHNSPGPYGWGSIDMYPYYGLSGYYLLEDNSKLIRLHEEEKKKREELENSLKVANQQLSIEEQKRLQAEQLLDSEIQQNTIVNQSLKIEEQARLQAESTLKNIESKISELENRLKTETQANIELRRQLEQITSDPEYIQFMDKKAQEIKKREEEEKRKAEELRRQEEARKAIESRKQHDEELEAILRKYKSSPEYRHWVNRPNSKPSGEEPSHRVWSRW